MRVPRRVRTHGLRGTTATRAKRKAGKDDSFAGFVVEQLQSLGDVTGRAMFGGHGLYSGEIFFGIVFGGRLYLRTDEGSRDEYVKRGMKPFRPSAKQTPGRYYEVPLDVLEDSGLLVEWARRAVQTG